MVIFSWCLSFENRFGADCAKDTLPLNNNNHGVLTMKQLKIGLNTYVYIRGLFLQCVK